MSVAGLTFVFCAFVLAAELVLDFFVTDSLPARFARCLVERFCPTSDLGKVENLRVERVILVRRSAKCSRFYIVRDERDQVDAKILGGRGQSSVAAIPCSNAPSLGLTALSANTVLAQALISAGLASGVSLRRLPSALFNRW